MVCMQATMQVTKYAHSCVVIESGDARLLIDPGSFSAGFEDITGLSAVLVTHQHPDHLDLDRLPALLARNPDAKVHTDPGSAQLLTERGIDAVAVHPGDELDVGTPVSVHGGQHAVIHPDIPQIPNVGYLVGGRFYHPGDSFEVPDAEVEVLGLPTGAPWLKLSEAIDFLRAVNPAVALPIHEGVLAVPEMYYGHHERLAPPGTTVHVVGPGQSLRL